MSSAREVPARNEYRALVDEEIRRTGARPMTAEELQCSGAFESDEEVDEFIADLYAFRREHLA